MVRLVTEGALAVLLLVASSSLADDSPWTEEGLGDALLRTVSLLLGQEFMPEEMAPPEYKDYALNDTSNDDLQEPTLQHIVKRSGFQYEDYKVTSADGYVTNLLRLVNPRADRRRLKQPPVMMVNGGIIDHTVWVWPSAIQHFPEPWPRSPQDGPIRSWNRSLAFTLANNGYDVWIAGTRGSNDQNKGHLKYNIKGGLFDEPGARNSDDSHRRLMERFEYWNYTFDDMAHYELPAQIDRVLKLSGARNITLLAQSFSSIYAPMTLVERPEYLKRLHNSVFMIPIINSRGTNRFLATVQEIIKLIPVKLGVVLAEIGFSKPLRDTLEALASNLELRYSLVKAVVLALAGPSPRYQSLLEPAVNRGLFKSTSFKEIKHWAQIVSKGELQHYDYGSSKNKQLYGSQQPARYDLTKLDLGNWMMLSTDQDVLAPPASARQFLRISRTPPVEHVIVPGYNHLDALAALGNDHTVVRPILAYLDRFHLPAGGGGNKTSQNHIAGAKAKPAGGKKKVSGKATQA